MPSKLKDAGCRAGAKEAFMRFHKLWPKTVCAYEEFLSSTSRTPLSQGLHRDEQDKLQPSGGPDGPALMGGVTACFARSQTDIKPYTARIGNT